MWATSATFRAALRQSHAVVTRADILRGGVVIASGVPIESGAVDVDVTATSRRRCQVTIVADPSYVPSLVPSATGVLSVFGNEIALYRGLRTPSGFSEVLPLGVFRIEEVETLSRGPVTVAVSGYDRASSVAESRFERVQKIDAGTNLYDAIVQGFVDIMPGLTYRFAPLSGVTVPKSVAQVGDDPWAFYSRMATDNGYELFFDPDGALRLRSVVDPTSATAVFEYVDGADSTMVEVANRTSGKPAYNKWIVSGENSGLTERVAVPRATAQDTNPASPTFYGGPFGKRPRFYKSQFITKQAQAVAVANAFKAREHGGTTLSRWSAIPNPAHEGGDVVRLASTKLAIDSNVVMQAFSIPLGVGSLMPVTSRAVQA